MKSLILYINEKLKITNDNIEPINTIYPKNRLELLDIIDDRGKNVIEYMDVSDIDLSDYVDNLGIIFYLNDNLTEIDGLETWDVSHVKKMHQMFQNCTKLKRIDLSTWDVSNVIRFDGMFDGCNNLEYIGDLSKWKIDKDADLTKMFNGCPDKLIKSLPKHILERIKT